MRQKSEINPQQLCHRNVPQLHYKIKRVVLVLYVLYVYVCSMIMPGHTSGSQRATCRCLSVFPFYHMRSGEPSQVIKLGGQVPLPAKLHHRLPKRLFSKKEGGRGGRRERTMMKKIKELAPLGLDIPVLRKRKQRNKKGSLGTQ